MPVKVSVIVPVFNPGAFLDRCVDSVLGHHPGCECRILREVLFNFHTARGVDLRIDIGVKLRLGDRINHPALRQP